MNDENNKFLSNKPEAGNGADPMHSEDAAVDALRKTLQQRLVKTLPEGVQSKLEDNLPEWQQQAQKALQGTKEFLGPLWHEAQIVFKSVSQQLATKTVSHSIGSTFRHVCVVGLNRSELLLQGENQPVFSESWADLAGDNIKRNTALLFFAPRGLDGKPVNPYLFLMGEGIPDEEDMVDNNAVAAAEQHVGPSSLLDLCRMSKSAPNTVNILVAADVLFHWDVKDNYVLPTSPTTWVRDVEQVLKGYPRTTRAHVYTQWDADLLPPSERISVSPLRDLPLDETTWLNKPTFQERYGNHALVTGLGVAAVVYAGLWYQGRQLQEVSDRLAIIEQQIPRGGQFSDLERAVGEQEKMWRKRDLLPLVVKDTARAIQNSGIQVTQFEVRTPEPETPPKQYVITIDAKNDVYQGWLQQEPVARALILNSSLIDAIRKPPTTSGFKLEALVNATQLEKDYKPFASQLNKAAITSSPTVAVSTSAQTQPNATEGDAE